MNEQMDRAISNDAVKRMVATIALAAIERVDGLPVVMSEDRKADAALDFVVGYIEGIRACGFEAQAQRLALEFHPLLGPGFYGEMRRLVERAKKGLIQ